VKYEKLGRYYLPIPLVIKKKENNENKIIAFDPGARTFQTGFTSEGSFVEYRKRRMKELFALGNKMDI
jgi:transposase